MNNVEFHFDFGSPNAYLAHAVLPEIEERTGVLITRIPILLGGVFKLVGNQSPVEAFGHIRNKPEYLNLEIKRFVERHKIPYQWNQHFPINTLMLMRGAIAAQSVNIFDKYVETIYKAMWVDGLDMGQVHVVRSTLEQSGIEADEIFRLIQEPDVKQKLIDNTENSVARGCFGSPTFFVNDEMYFGKENLGQFESEIFRQKSEAAI